MTERLPRVATGGVNEFEAYQPADQNCQKKLSRYRLEKGEGPRGSRCGSDVAEPGGRQGVRR